MTTPRALPIGPACLCLCVLLLGCDAELHHGLGERQANRALLGLREAGFAADKRAERGRAGYTLTVPRGDETRALQLLEERGLVRPPAPRPSPGLLPLPEELRQQRAYDLGEQIAATLEGLPQVIEARVHLTLPPEDPLRPPAAELAHGGAAVLLRLRAPLPLTNIDVAQLVARSAPGLQPGDVTVLSALQPAAAPPPAGLVRVGPLLVAQGSQRLAAALLGALCLLGAATLLLLARRRGPATS